MYPSKKLVPYVLKKKQTDTLIIYKFSFFLTNGGKGVWELSQGEQADETLSENGFVVDGLYETEDIIYAQINKASFDLSSVP